MPIAFIEQEKIERGVKREELELVDLMTEDRQQLSVNQKRSKPHMTKEFLRRLKENLDRVNEDLA
jgi:hypothetical protein